MTTVTLNAVIEKQDTEQRRFFGVAYLHKSVDGEQVVDHSGDVIDTPEAQAALEESFYTYMKDSRSGDAGHELFDAATLIEGYVVTAEKKRAGLFPDGMAEGVYVGFEANDSESGDVLWDRVRSGEYKAFSIVGTATTEDI